jgi:hypothetical protein
MWGFPTHTAASERGFTDYYNNIYVMGSNKHFYKHDIVLEPIIIMSISSWGMNESHWTRAFG